MIRRRKFTSQAQKKAYSQGVADGGWWLACLLALMTDPDKQEFLREVREQPEYPFRGLGVTQSQAPE